MDHLWQRDPAPEPAAARAGAGEHVVVEVLVEVGLEHAHVRGVIDAPAVDGEQEQPVNGLPVQRRSVSISSVI